MDEMALINALNNNRIKFTILDVFFEEPLPEKNQLWDQLKDHASKTHITLPRKLPTFRKSKCHNYATVLPIPNRKLPRCSFILRR